MGLILTIVHEGLNKFVLFKNSNLCSLGSNSKDSKFSGGIAKLVLFEIRFRNPFPKGGRTTYFSHNKTGGEITVV